MHKWIGPLIAVLIFALVACREVNFAEKTEEVSPSSETTNIQRMGTDDEDISAGGDLPSALQTPTTVGSLSNEPEVTDICAAVSEIPVAECQALVAFYNSTDGPNWTLKRGWLETEQPCDWAGVDCVADHVSALTMNYNELRGSLPPELGHLSELQTLALYFNYLEGPVPPELGNLAQLQRLILHNNRLDGPIPPELGRLSKLKELDLESNALSGPIPASLGQMARLEILNLTGNNLDGPIPSELGRLANLRGLFLAGNNLTGNIPPELGNLANLWMVNLSYNDLSGDLPPTLQDLPGSGYSFFKWNQSQPAKK